MELETPLVPRVLISLSFIPPEASTELETKVGRIKELICIRVGDSSNSNMLLPLKFSTGKRNDCIQDDDGTESVHKVLY